MLVPISPQCTLAFSCAYACACLTSANQTLSLFSFLSTSSSIKIQNSPKLPRIHVGFIVMQMSRVNHEKVYYLRMRRIKKNIFFDVDIVIKNIKT